MEFYAEKMGEVSGVIKNFDISKIELADELEYFRQKSLRMAEKYKAVKWEIEGRKKGFFNRKPVGTIYYIDLAGGNDGNTGLTILQSWLTLQQYTRVTARTAGDIAKVRAGTTQTEIATDINFDEDGDQDDYIEIRGCSVADDPWSDVSDVKPILTFADSNFQLFPNGDNFWKINRMIIKESADANGNVSMGTCWVWHYSNCEFTDNSNAIGEGISMVSCPNILFESCVFKDNLRSNLLATAGTYFKCISCTLDGGVTTTSYGLYVWQSHGELIDCDFGQTTEHGLADIYAARGGIVKLRNCKLATVGIDVVDPVTVVYEEDADGVYGAYKGTHYQGTVTKDTGIKTGNATFSMKLEPTAFCGVNNPLTLNDDSLIKYPFNILCTTGVAKTVTIKIRSLGAWATYPTNTELYIEFSYLSNGASAARTTIASVQVLSHASDWVSFTVTFTPLQTGIAYGAVYLKLFEGAGDGCYVNMEAT